MILLPLFIYSAIRAWWTYSICTNSTMMFTKTPELHKTNLTFRLFFIIIFLIYTNIFIIFIILGMTKFKAFLLGPDPPCWRTDVAILNESESVVWALLNFDCFLIGESSSIFIIYDNIIMNNNITSDNYIINF